ncbi:rhomboid family intramembrane serine protease [Mucisphaera sp.]|uniref:rhomboid family intramembrane serine protease n=1 Tax=Mucisphaera sp. TaxID=2913024 RepID=UPI003D0F4A46
MSWENRDYNRPGPGGFNPRPGGRLASASVVKWLLIINAVVFVWDSIMLGSRRGSALGFFPYGYFSVDEGIYGLQVWRLFTYQFLHADLFHILFNMIGLFFFGPLLEQTLGSRRFLAFYLLCGVSGAIIASLLGAIPGLIMMPPSAILIGASGSLFGILAACAVLFPNLRVMLLIPPVPLSMRTMALIFLGIAALSVLAGAQNDGGEAAHLGGALLGFFLIKNPGWLGFADGLSMSSPRELINRKLSQIQADQLAKDQAEVDRILDKVRDKGIQSLTRSERKTLQRDTDRKRRAG